jgi:Dullard-like phosphatase family protein
MLQHMRFKALLNVDGCDPDCPWPAVDPYVRYGAESFPQDGQVIWFEPLPPMLPDLELNPKLPPCSIPDGYTLVLDLDETLVHYHELDGMGRYDIRPGMCEFIESMHSLGYELVIFTAATQDYADWVIDQIDPEGLIHHRLYRQHALPWGPIFVKDLSRLGRDFDRMLIIDNVQENFMLQPHNGIFIITWYDDPNDTALFGLTPLLDELITTRARVPEILNKYRDQIPSWAGFDQYTEGYSEFDQGLPDENDIPAPLMASSGSPIDRRQQGLHSAFAKAAPTPGKNYSTYAARSQQPPSGMDSVGVTSETSPSLVRPDASPTSSPPAPVHRASPSIMVHHQAAPAQKSAAVSEATTMPSGSSLVADTGSQKSSSYVASPFPAQRASVNGYTQAAKVLQAPASAGAAQQARPATIIRQTGISPAAQTPNMATSPMASALAQATTMPAPNSPAQTHGRLTTVMANQATPQRASAPTRQVSTQQMSSAMPMTHPAATFSSISGPYQSAPPLLGARPSGGAIWGQAGFGPHPAQPPQVLNRR